MRRDYRVVQIGRKSVQTGAKDKCGTMIGAGHKRDAPKLRKALIASRVAEISAVRVEFSSVT